MKNFEGFMEEVGKFLEQTEAILSEIVNDYDAEQEKKGVSWDELSNWIAESEHVEEFKVDTDAEDLTYVTKDDDLCEGCADCGQCRYCEGCNCEEEEPASESLSLLDYREALFRHSEERNSEYPQEASLKLTEVFSNVIWEVLESPNTATPEDIATAHNILCDSRYLRALIKSQVNFPGMEIDVLGVENEIENYLKEEN